MVRDSAPDLLVFDKRTLWQQKKLSIQESFFVVVIITKGMRVKYTPKE